MISDPTRLYDHNEKLVGIQYYLTSGNRVIWLKNGFIGPLRRDSFTKDAHPGWYVWQNFNVVQTLSRGAMVAILRQQYITNLESHIAWRKGDIKRHQDEIAVWESKIKHTQDKLRRAAQAAKMER